MNQISYSQGTYFSDADFVYLKEGNPDNLDSVQATDQRTIYFDMSSIDTNANRLDICIGYNEIHAGASTDYLWGNWLRNQDNVNFNYENPDFRFIYQAPSILSDSITGLCFINLKENQNKNLVVLRANGDMEIRDNFGKIQISDYQTVDDVYGKMPVTGKFSNDTLEDVAIISPTSIRVFKGSGGSNPPLEEVFELEFSNIKKIYLAQINKHYFPYSDIYFESSDRDEIVAQFGNNILIFNNNNNNTTNSTPTTLISFSDFLADFKIADVNNDGYNDIISITQYELPNDLTTYSRISFFLNNSGSINTSANFFIEGIRYSNSMVFADFNKDGWNDMLIDKGTDTIALFLNTKISTYFNSNPTESFRFENAPGPFLIPVLFASKIAAVDLYNKGGLGVVMSGWVAVTSLEKFESNIRINATNIDPPPAPAYLFRKTTEISGVFRPKLLLFNHGDRDFKQYKIYKRSAFTNWIYTLIDSTTGSEYIDTQETLDTTSTPDEYNPPAPNLFYYVLAEDNSDQLSISSDTIKYASVICPTCPTEPTGPSEDNIVINSNSTNEAVEDSPKEFSISNYPNPFNPTTKIYYTIPKEGNVKITIYNSVGKEVKVLVNEFKGIGSYVTSFEGHNLSSGIYFYRIEAGSFIQTKRMILLK